MSKRVNEWECVSITSPSQFSYPSIETITIDKQVILECITLLTQSGSNTKAIVAEKLKGLVE